MKARTTRLTHCWPVCKRAFTQACTWEKTCKEIRMPLDQTGW
jgi:hypothetical protein